MSSKASLARLPGEIQHSIQEGKMGHQLTGVVPGSDVIQILEKSIQ